MARRESLELTLDPGFLSPRSHIAPRHLDAIERLLGRHLIRIPGCKIQNDVSLQPSDALADTMFSILPSSTYSGSSRTCFKALASISAHK